MDYFVKLCTLPEQDLCIAARGGGGLAQYLKTAFFLSRKMDYHIFSGQGQIKRTLVQSNVPNHKFVGGNK